MNDDAEYKRILEKALAAGRSSNNNNSSNQLANQLSQLSISSNPTLANQLANQLSQLSVSAKKKRAGPKNINKVMSGKQLAKHQGASAWRTALSDLGYLKKGSQFKRIPEKNSVEYNKIKALQKAYENKAFK